MCSHWTVWSTRWGNQAGDHICETTDLLIWPKKCSHILGQTWKGVVPIVGNSSFLTLIWGGWQVLMVSLQKISSFNADTKFVMITSYSSDDFFTAPVWFLWLIGPNLRNLSGFNLIIYDILPLSSTAWWFLMNAKPISSGENMKQSFLIFNLTCYIGLEHGWQKRQKYSMVILPKISRSFETETKFVINLCILLQWWFLYRPSLISLTDWSWSEEVFLFYCIRSMVTHTF